jgi:hypothetical protein
MIFLFLPCNCTLVSLFYFFFCMLFWESNHFAGNSLRSRHSIRCFLSFSLVLSFTNLYLVLTCICWNIEDNVNFKLGGGGGGSVDCLMNFVLFLLIV